MSYKACASTGPVKPFKSTLLIGNLIVILMSINGQSILQQFYNNCQLILEPIGRMTQTLNHIMYAERDHLKIV